MKKRYTDDQIIGAVKRLEAGMSAKELSREMGVTQQSLYHWKRKFSGMDVTATPANSKHSRLRTRA